MLSKLKLKKYLQNTLLSKICLIDLFGGDYHGYIKCLKGCIEMFGVDSNSLEIKIM